MDGCGRGYLLDHAFYFPKIPKAFTGHVVSPCPNDIVVRHESYINWVGFRVISKLARTSLYDGALKNALGLTSQAQFMAMPTHPLPIQFLIDSSVRYVFMLNGATISWRASRTTLIVLNAAEADQYSLSSATQKKPSVCTRCVSSSNSFKPTRLSCTGIAKQLSPCQWKTNSAIAANTSPFAGALLSNDKVLPLAK